MLAPYDIYVASLLITVYFAATFIGMHCLCKDATSISCVWIIVDLMLAWQTALS